MNQSGSVHAEGNIRANDIITGLKIDHLTVVFNSLDQLAELLSQPDTVFRAGPTGELAVLAGEQPRLSLPPNLLEAFKQLPRAADLAPADRQRAYAAWLVTRQPQRPVQRAAARHSYIPLQGHTSWDWQEDPLQPRLSWLRPVGEGPERRLEREPLADVAEAVQRFNAFVLLGPPGSGKSTVLERLIFSAAQAYLAGHSPRLPLGLTLASYHWQRHAPLEFVRERWTALLADDFIDLARAGQVLLLLDGLNEMPRLDHPDDRAQRAAAWSRFVDDFFAEESVTGSRAVIASRDAGDYQQRLGLPRVEIDPLTPVQIEQFSQAYLAEEAPNFLSDLSRLTLESQASNPFSLYILTQLYDPARRGLPANRGLMLAQYATGLLSVMYPHQEESLQAARQALAELGYAMQQAGEGTVLPAETMLGHLPASVKLPGQRRPLAVNPEEVFERACRAGLLALVDEAQDSHKFSHQLLQEQFAAHGLLACWQSPTDLAELWRVPRTAAEMPAPAGGEWDPLPPPPATGWEQTTLLAAGLTNRPDDFGQAVLAHHPALAGRCLSEGHAQVTAGTQTAVQQALLADLSDPDLHRRTRLQAGQVLGAVGDPRFVPVELNGVSVILPELVEVPGGTATLGSDSAEADNDEQPVHQVEVAPFYLARTPVTNAEYACFIQAGGYDSERFWTPTGWQWRQGQLETSGPMEEWLQARQAVLQDPDLPERFFNEGRLTPDTRDTLQTIARMSEEELRQALSSRFAPQPHEQPAFWDDPAYNGPTQPVVGVTWYEAMAYCAWLHERLAASRQPLTVDGQALEGAELLVSGRWQVRLPTEAEWEWAAGGPQHLTYPWGSEFDEDKANTLEGRVLGTSPVGTYPAGAAACGALDMSGNIYEWTHTLFRDYPYQAEDGREDPLAEGRRALRGGSWSLNLRSARVSSRIHIHPDNFNYISGFRYIVAPVLSF